MMYYTILLVTAIAVLSRLTSAQGPCTTSPCQFYLQAQALDPSAPINGMYLKAHRGPKNATFKAAQLVPDMADATFFDYSTENTHLRIGERKAVQSRFRDVPVERLYFGHDVGRFYNSVVQCAPEYNITTASYTLTCTCQRRSGFWGCMSVENGKNRTSVYLGSDHPRPHKPTACSTTEFLIVQPT